MLRPQIRVWYSAGAAKGKFMTINTTIINSLQVEVTALRVLYEEVKRRQDESDKKIDLHDRVLVSGDSDHLSLSEVVRNLSKTVSDYITQKDKEEQKNKRFWALVGRISLGVIIPAFLFFLWQAFIFYFKIYPVLVKLSQ